MKRIITVALASMLLASCQIISDLETKFLTVESIGKSTIESFFEEITGLEAAGEGLHHEMEKFFDSYYFKYAEIAGENLSINVVSASEGDYLLYNYEMREEHVATYPRNVWGNGWEVVTNANNVIYYGNRLLDREELLKSDILRIQKIVAWGYFTRALMHFSICNCYAQPYCYTPDASHIGIPVVDYIPKFEDQIGRKSVAEVYDLILSDLEKAMNILAEGDYKVDCFHVSDVACEALLARVHLYMQDWDNAAKYAKSVMDKIPLTKNEDYINMFRDPFGTNGSEAIFRLNQYDGSSSLVSIYDPTRSSGYDFFPNPSMHNMFEEGDVRADLLTYIPEDCEDESVKGKTFNAVCKHLAYKSLKDEKTIIPCPFVLRGSEMYLIHAEAVANGTAHDLNAAADDIKTLEARARGIAKTDVSLDYSDLDTMNKLIKQERVKELSFEGHSIFDSIRRGEAVTRPEDCNAKIKRLEYGDHRTILPIDQMEMQANDNMEQNEGYR
ncbi:MAG: RagB/SusD family nutrient uptake outer membrane protein [Bacteroidales bacterium]|nr:RagB/SusD family nutrient uptake outer membrane protein [Bacteroidales bacterium]